MDTEKKIKDSERNAKFDSMLKIFAEIIDGNPPIDKVKDELVELKEACQSTGLLTLRQSDAIIGRCNNYLNGTYGVDKVKDIFFKNA